MATTACSEPEAALAGGDHDRSVRWSCPTLEAGESEIHSAARDGDARRAYNLLLERKEPAAGAAVKTAGPGNRSLDPVADARLSDYTTPLHLAARNGHADVVGLLLAAGAYPTPVDVMGRTPLGLAVENLHDECRELIRAAGGRINEADETFDGKYWSKRLHAATEDGDVETVRRIVARKLCANVDAAKSVATDDTPLFVALRDGHLEIAKILLEQGGASPLKRLRSGRTPLHVVVEEGKRESVRFLVRNVADAETRDQCLLECDQSHYTALLRAAQCSDYGVALELLAAGAEHDRAPTPDGKNAAETAKECGNETTAAMFVLWLTLEPFYKDMDALEPQIENDVEVVGEVLEIALPSTRENPEIKETPPVLLSGKPSEAQLDAVKRLWQDFKRAIERDDEASIIELLPDFVENNEKLPEATEDHENLAAGTKCSLLTKALLHYARKGTDLNVLRTLLSDFPTHVDVNARDSRRQTPLHMAVNAGNAPFVRALLEAGADPDAVNDAGLSPLDVAMFRRIGVEHRGDMAMKRRCAEEIAAFSGRSGGGDPRRLPDEFLDFVRVLENEKPEQVEEYLEKNPGTCARRDFMGRGPLHWVADYPYWIEEMKTGETARIIVEKSGGKDLVTLADKRGDTPLHLARKPSLVRFLLDAGADVDAKNAAGNTPLDSLREELDVYDLEPVTNAHDELEKHPTQAARRRAAAELRDVEFEELKFHKLSRAERNVFEKRLEELREDCLDAENEVAGLEKKIQAVAKEIAALRNGN